MAVGTPCIANRMGAACDQIQPYPGENSDGFLFDDLAPDTLLRTLRKALAVRNSTEEWSRLQQNGIRRTFQWDVTASSFLDLANF